MLTRGDKERMAADFAAYARHRVESWPKRMQRLLDELAEADRWGPLIERKRRARKPAADPATR
jgi:hypothetical protein